MPEKIKTSFSEMKQPFGSDEYYAEFRMRLEKTEFTFAPDLLQNWQS